ncbi:MAG TPA: SRPBCC family protein [Nocardioidaceae bacterium]|nr:SRPBCC family protein [Nocardioidaceae bacterium]
MDLTHSFTVPASLEETWNTFQDIEDIGACFPGAVVTSVEGDEFKGTVKVKLGPIALQYAGTGAFVSRDESAHRFVVEAKGKDKRGNGTAAATVTAVMTAEAPESTSVEVKTDLSITGKPAQFGRGVIQDVSNKLLQQFIDCLESKVGAPAEEAPALAAAAAAEAPPPEQLAPAPAGGPEVVTGAAPEISPVEVAGAGAAEGAAAGAPSAAPPTTTPAAGKRKAEQVEAIDLGATVLPIVLKAYWKQIAGAVLALLILRRLLRRRRD